MRNSLLAATFIAFGTTVAMPATAAVKIERYAFEQPQMQKGDTLALGVAGNSVTTGSTAGTKTSDQYQKLIKAAKGETSDQHQKMNAGEGVTTGSAASHDIMSQWYQEHPGQGPG